MEINKIVTQRLLDSIAVKESIINNSGLINTIAELAIEIAKAIQNGNKLILCGNGGSGSDALHFAGEVVGRFQKERSAWPAIVLNSDVATMTAISNDYGYNNVFARQVEGHAKPGDILIGISTSGNSENVFRAIQVANKNGVITGALLGKDGGKIKNVSNFPIVVNSDVTARIQESHICIIHIICELLEDLIVLK